MRLSSVATALATILALATFLAVSSAARAAEPVTIKLVPQNNSGISGSVMLTPQGDKTKVSVTLTGSSTGGPHPNHIHAGTCAKLEAKPAYPLTVIQNNAGETTVDVSLDKLQASQFAVNVHKSPQEASVYVSCADIPMTVTSHAPAAMPATGDGGLGLAGAGLGGLLAALVAAGVVSLRRRRA